MSYIKEDDFKLSKREIEKQKKKSLELSIKEGSAASVMSGAGSSFISPFALALNASNLQIGFLSSFVGLIGPLAQLQSIHLMEHYSRKKIVVITVLIQALLWLPIMLLGAMYYFKFWLDYLAILLIIFYSLNIGVGAIASPAWFSWMGDLVPENKRGKYFSRRNRITGFVAIISMLIAGIALDFFKTKGLVLTGFTIIFSVSIISRLYSAGLLNKHYSPKFKLKNGYYFSFNDFIKKGLNTNFGRFTMYVALINFAVAIAAPFFTVYMLRDLGLSYIWFTLISLSSSVFSLLVFPFWGKFADKYGNRMVIIISSIFLPLVPILWIISPSKLYLLFVPSLVGGIFWAGFNLSAFNFIYDCTNPEHRAICSVYHNMIVGIGIFAGAIFGGLIAKYSSITIMGNVFFFIFAVSGVLRIVFALIYLPKIKEIKHFPKPPMLIKEIKLMHNIGHNINHMNASIMHSPYHSRYFSKRLRKLKGVFD